MRLAGIYFGVSPAEVRQLAYVTARELHFFHQVGQGGGKASSKWLRRSLRLKDRHNLKGIVSKAVQANQNSNTKKAEGRCKEKGFRFFFIRGR